MVVLYTICLKALQGFFCFLKASLSGRRFQRPYWTPAVEREGGGRQKRREGGGWREKTMKSVGRWEYGMSQRSGAVWEVTYSSLALDVTSRVTRRRRYAAEGSDFLLKKRSDKLSLCRCFVSILFASINPNDKPAIFFFIHCPRLFFTTGKSARRWPKNGNGKNGSRHILGCRWESLRRFNRC